MCRGLARPLLLLLVLSHAALFAEEKPAPTDPLHAEKMTAGLKLFKEEVRDIFLDRCVYCHGGDETEGHFDLTSRERLLEGGKSGDIVYPGKSKQSWLYKLITHAEKPAMPKDDSKLEPEKIEAIAKWIDLGAPYDEPLVEKEEDPAAWVNNKVREKDRLWWSFAPLGNFAPPQVQNNDWPRTDIDRFIQAKFEEKGLHGNGPLEKQKLIRRAYFDLIGLPPTPEEVETFVKSDDPQAYEKLIDQLLASPHFGERWARHWLDVARFAESHGFEQDYDRPHAYHFRDFVIKAFNQDLPYDQFVQWQIAGDEIAPDNPLAMTATGFLGAGVFPTQITKNEVERTRYDALDDMAATIGSGMLGFTVGCARCHDHKFDPIPQADYYRLISTFTTTVRSNIELPVPSADYEEKLAKREQEITSIESELAKYESEQLPAAFANWLGELAQGENNSAQPWATLEPLEIKSSAGATFQRQTDASWLATGANGNADVYTIVVETGDQPLQSLRLEALAHPSMTRGGPGRASNGNFGLGEIRVSRQAAEGEGEPQEVKLLHPRVTFEQNKANLSIAASLDGNNHTGWAVDPQFGKDHAAAFQFEKPIEGKTRLTITLDFNVNTKHNIGRLRLSAGRQPQPPLVGETLPAGVGEALASLQQAGSAEKLSGQQRETLLNWYKPQNAAWQALKTKLTQHETARPQPAKTITAMVCSEGVTAIRHHTQGGDFLPETHFLARGECEKKVAVAPQGFPQVLSRAPEGDAHWIEQPPAGSKLSYRRKSLANWIVDTEYGPGHLLARVIVNRLWQHHMGQGLVATPNDFGKQGTPPTHPELLDWLAGELIRGGWKLKPIHKLIMTSAVYMQNGDTDQQRSEIDIGNQFLWRRPPARLEAELIRDSMLAVSGQLDRTMFGPGTLNEGHKRRSIYFMIKRSKLIPVLQLFDMPEPLVSVGGRPATTIAPQALYFMNNPQVRLYASSFGSRLAANWKESPEEAVKQGYLLTLGREPDAEELAANSEFITSQEASYKAAGKNNARALALADFSQVLFSLNEFVFVE